MTTPISTNSSSPRATPAIDSSSQLPPSSVPTTPSSDAAKPLDSEQDQYVRTDAIDYSHTLGAPNPTPLVSGNTNPDLQGQLESSRGRAHLAGPGVGSAPTDQSSENNYDNITSHLSRSVTDWAVTDGDVRAVHDQLDGLSGSDYRATIERMDQDGNLGTYVNQMNSGAREDFLAQARDKGYLESVPGRDYDVPSAQPQPPSFPELYRHDSDQPSSIREAIHDSNVDRFQTYKGEYRTYIDDYSDRVMAAGSEDEIRAMGPPVNSHTPMEPGLRGNDPMKDRWAREAIAFTPSHQPAYVAIGNKQDDLNGEVRPGSFFVSGEVSWQQPDDGSGDTQLGGKIGGRLYHYGAVEAEAKGSASNIMGTPIAGEAGVTGLRTPGGTTNIQLDGGLKAEGAFDTEDSRIGRVVPLSAEIAQNGKVELGLDAVDVDSPLGDVGVRSFASSDPSSNTLEMGVSGDLETSRGTVQVKGGAGMRGITADEIVDAMNNPGFFD